MRAALQREQLAIGPSPTAITNIAIWRNPAWRATYGLLGIGIALSCFILRFDAPLAIVPLAIMCGWSEVDGRCGISHIGALCPLYAYSPFRKLWLKSIAAYTVGGLTSATLVGAGMGWLSNYWSPMFGYHALYFVATIVSLLLVLREARALAFRLPQIDRQTHKMWAADFGIAQAAAMWGMHIGLGFATVIRHGGFWFLVVMIAGLQSSRLGGELMGAYWVGRTLPLWLSPLIVRFDQDALNVWYDVSKRSDAYRHLTAAAMALAGMISASLAGL